MKSSTKNKLTIFMIFGFLSVCFTNCSIVGSELKFGSSDNSSMDSGGGTTVGNGKLSLMFAPFDENATSVTHLNMCIKRFRMKSDANSASVDLNLGKVQIKSKGTDLGEINIPSGWYKRIELELEPQCGPGGTNSVEVKIGTGDNWFKSTEAIKMRFDGDFHFDSSSNQVGIIIDGVLQRLGTITSDADIKTKVEDDGLPDDDDDD